MMAGRGGEKTTPAANAVSVTKSDTTEYGECRGIYVGTGGDLAVQFRINKAVVTLANVPSGSLLPIDVLKVMSTNTTASDIVLLF